MTAGIEGGAPAVAMAPPLEVPARLMGWRGGRLASGARAIIQGIDSVGRVALVLALLGELSVVLTDITIRFVATQSLLWTDEASKLCLTMLAFVGGALAYRARHHTAIQFVTRFFPETARAGVAVAVDGFILSGALIALYVSFDLLEISATSLTPILQISTIWIVLPFSVGMALVALFAVERLVFAHPARSVLTVLPVVVAAIAAVVAYSYLPIARPSNGAALAVMLVLFFVAVLLGLPVSFAMLLGSIFFLQITDSPR